MSEYKSPVYKELDGSLTFHKGKKVIFWRRWVYSLYKKFVNEPFIPKSAKFLIQKYPSIHKTNEVKSIRVTYKGLNTGRFESYIFSDFNEIKET